MKSCILCLNFLCFTPVQCCKILNIHNCFKGILPNPFFSQHVFLYWYSVLWQAQGSCMCLFLGKTKYEKHSFLRSCVQLEWLWVVVHSFLSAQPAWPRQSSCPSPCCPVPRLSDPPLLGPYFLDWKTEAKLTTLHSEAPSCCCPVFWSSPIPTSQLEFREAASVSIPTSVGGQDGELHPERGWKHEAASWTGLRNEYACAFNMTVFHMSIIPILKKN